MRTAFVVFALMGLVSSAHSAVDIETALSKARTSCGGISEELNTMKTLAGIGTAVSATGTLTGGAATVTGIVKAQKDAIAMTLTPYAEKWQELKNKHTSPSDKIAVLTYRQKKDFSYWMANLQPSNTQSVTDWRPDLQEYRQGTDAGTTGHILGDIRTGTLAATTATNIAGAVVGGVNMKKARGSLSEQVSECLASVKELSAAYGQARISRTASEEDLGRIETIVRVCDEWSTVDLSKIDNRATGAFASSVVGAATGAAGTITSALANTDENHLSGTEREKNLNKASNILAGGATVASGAATIFNATQISVIKRASTVADACEGALK